LDKTLILLTGDASLCPKSYAQRRGYVPKWEPRSKRGQFVGYSPLHASSVGMIRNLNTHHVPPQFHVMYDDFFETVHSSERNPHPKDLCERLYTFNRSQVDWDHEPPDLPVE